MLEISQPAAFLNSSAGLKAQKRENDEAVKDVYKRAAMTVGPLRTPLKLFIERS